MSRRRDVYGVLTLLLTVLAIIASGAHDAAATSGGMKGGGSAPVVVNVVDYSLPRLAAAAAVQNLQGAGSQTNCQGVVPMTSGVKVTGVEVYVRLTAAGPATIQTYMVQSTGAVTVAAVSTSAPSSGLLTVTWPTTTLTQGAQYYLCWYRSDAAEYSFSQNLAAVNNILVPPAMTGLVLVNGWNYWTSAVDGHTVPVNTAASERYDVRGFYTL